MDEIRDLVVGLPLSSARTEALFSAILGGGVDAAQIAAILALMQARGVTAEELAAAARVMRRHVETVPFTPEPSQRVVDTCGTGGAPKTFNVSTAAAIVAAGAHQDIVVAKHGNRSRTGRGSAEVLGALGVNLDAPAPVLAACLRQARVCFCFAIHHHPAMKHAAEPRASLGIPTIFNLLGPLTNPARAERQLIGVYRPELVSLVADALAELGVERALVVHSREGLDEIGLAAPTDAVLIEPGGTRAMTIEPDRLGLRPVPREALLVEDVDASADIIRRVLAGETGGHRDIVLINAAAAVFVAGITDDLPEALVLAERSIDSGAAAATLESLARASHAGV
ncbi:MAG: anthranilate phosphoribosyltransferase [Planctomycetota bacterium]